MEPKNTEKIVKEEFATYLKLGNTVFFRGDSGYPSDAEAGPFSVLRKVEEGTLATFWSHASARLYSFSTFTTHWQLSCTKMMEQGLASCLTLAVFRSNLCTNYLFIS